jgi:uncharacterized damage-inducible protein DinB
MPTKKTPKAPEPFAVVDSLLAAFAINNRINEFLIRAVPEEAWRADPPGGKGRNIAAIVAHMHNVRGMWLKAIGGNAGVPDKLERASCTKEEAIAALTESWRALDEVLRNSLSTDGRIKGFKPDASGFLGYLFAHDAHHRGQITMLARQLGHPVSQSAMFGMWEWGTR